MVESPLERYAESPKDNSRKALNQRAFESEVGKATTIAQLKAVILKYVKV